MDSGFSARGAPSVAGFNPALSGHHQSRLSFSNPALPLIIFFGGFPIWWAMGLGTLGFLLMAVPLTYHLLRQRKIRVPAGFGIWLLFLAILLLGALILWSPVPGLLSEMGVSRLAPWGYRVIWFSAVTVVFLFIGNTDERVLPRKWLILLMAWMFCLTVAGGYAGQLLWQHEFRSVLEIILPRSMTSNVFLGSLIHPGLAQVQDILGYSEPRPKAPFDYANSWGANYGLLLPFYLMSFRYVRTAIHKTVFVAILIAAVPPAIFSLNRGLWAGLGVLVVVVLIRQAINAQWFTVLGTVAIGALAFTVLYFSPLWGLIQTRLANPHSNEGRSNLADISVETVLANSPLIGFGSTRQRQGNFFSIASGATADCHQCSPPQLGTQGSLWYLIFCTGIFGLALFVWFIVRRTKAVITKTETWATPLVYPVVFFACILPVYDLVGSPLMILMITLALIWRFEQQQGTVPDRPERTRHGQADAL